MARDIIYTWICPVCDETNSFVGRGEEEYCWECGCKAPKGITANPEPHKPEAEKTSEHESAAVKSANELFPILVSKLASCNSHKMIEIIGATCRKNGFVFSKNFTSLILSDERFIHVVRVMSPSQKKANW